MNKKKKPVEKIDIVPEMLSSSAKSSDIDEEGMPSGFIGKYTQKLTKKEDAKQKVVLDELESNKQLGMLSYSKDAPKHKGMLARATEIDMHDE